MRTVPNAEPWNQLSLTFTRRGYQPVLPCSGWSSVKSFACLAATPSRSSSASRPFHFSTSFNACRLRRSARASVRSAWALCLVGSDAVGMERSIPASRSSTPWLKTLHRAAHTSFPSLFHHGRATMGEIIRLTGASRNTLKEHLAQLVDKRYRARHVAGRDRRSQRRGRERGHDQLLALNLRSRALLLLVRRMQKKHQPRLPVGSRSPNGPLSLQERKVVPLLAVLDDAPE